MPGNEVVDRFRSVFELSNPYPGQSPSQSFGGERLVLNYNQQLSDRGQIGAPLRFSLNNENTPLSGSVKGNINQYLQVRSDQTYTQLNQRPEFSTHFSRSDLLNTNNYTDGHQSFQRWQNQVLCSDENTETSWRNLTSASVDSPTLTTNSEKSEIAEASSDLDFLGWQQLGSGQQLSTSQPPSMQQSGFNDMQILQQTIMFKQLQELQRKQLQQLGDSRQQNSMNQFSATSPQAVGGQLPLLINGTPVRDSSSQVFMNLMQHSSSPGGQGVPNRMAFGQGVPNRMAFPQDQNESMHSTGQVSQQPDVSLHGTPVGRGTVNQYAHMQGMSRSSGNFLSKVSNGNQTQKHVMQSTFGNPFPGEHDTSSNDGGMLQGAFGQVSSQLGNTLHTNASFPDFNFRQEQVGNIDTMQQKTTQLGSPQSLIPLDPLEQKILYNLDDNSWDTSFGRSMGAGGSGSPLEQSDYSSALQSGSWSALMQTAVAEASSCDTGVQEEWSGLTFQSTEVSTDKNPSKFMDEERQQPGWANNLQSTELSTDEQPSRFIDEGMQQSGWANSDLQSPSSNSKPFAMLNNPSMSSSFPGFQQSGCQSSNAPEESLHHYDSHKPFQKSLRSAGEWSDYNSQQKSSNQTSQQVQPLTHLENTWAGQNYEHPERYIHETASHNKVSQLCNKQKGDDVNGAIDEGRDLDDHPWTGQMEQPHSRTNNLKREDLQVNYSAASPNVGTSKAHLPDPKATDKFDYMKHVGFSLNNNANESGGETQHLHTGTSDGHRNSTASYNSMGLCGPRQGHVAPQTSQHMHEPLHRVDRSRENSPMAHFSTVDHKDSSHVVSTVNPSQVNSDLGVNQVWLDSSSPVRSLPPNELSQRACWDERALTSGLPHVRSQLQTQLMNESSQATLSDSSSRYPPFNHASSQGTSRQASTGPFGQQFPSHVSPKSGMSARLQNTWKSVPASRLSSPTPSVDPSKNSMEAASLASLQGGIVSSDLGACSMDSQGTEYGDQPGKHWSRKEMSSEVIDTLQSGSLSEDKNYSVKHIPPESNQQDPDRVLHSDNHALTASERNLESFGRSVVASQTSHQNYTLLHQMQALKSSVETDPSKTAAIRRYNEANSGPNVQQISDILRQQSMYEQNSRFRNQTRVEELGGKALQQPILQPLQGIGTFNQNESLNQTKGVVYNRTENSQVNMHMVPAWFKQYGTLRNGIMQPMYDGSRPGQVESFSPGRTGNLGVSENFSSLDVMPSDLVELIRPGIRAKKRKTIGSERIPWHKEVTQGSQRLQDISTAEEDWAWATNRLTEKSEHNFELIGEEHPMQQRPKRRLVLTTQLTQQLLRPAPASVLRGNASSQYDTVMYFIAKLALGDACSLTYGSKKDFHVAEGNSDMISEKLKAVGSYNHFTQVVEDFTERAKKLESDFLRWESSSIADIRVECQELERYSVINRFAKFHMRGQAGTSGTGTSPLRSSPLKWVTALPMPRNIPEEAQCFSL